MRRRLILLGLAAVAVAVAAADRLAPPDLSRHRDRSTMVLDRDGRTLRAFTSGDGAWRLATTPAEVDPRYLAMLQSFEDRRFYSHAGVDPLAVVRAAWQAVRSGRIVSGASTLTMQAARLLEPYPRGLTRKLMEMARAVQLESRYAKDEILAFYLTLAPFGGNLEGVRAASLAWFGKEPAHLSIAESALLVALPQSPERLRPDLRPEAARAARDKVLRRMVAAGTIDATEATEAMEEKVPTIRRALPFEAPHLAERLRGEATPGSTIPTTIDGRLQRLVEGMARRENARFGDGAGLAILVVDNASREVRAWLGGADFFAPQGQVDLVRARRSPGSALKPFIYGLAFDEGIAHPESLVEDVPARFGMYAPRNFDRGFTGTLTIRAALQQSLNLPAVLALERIGPARFAASLAEAGAVLAMDRQADASLALALGGAGISLADLTMLYAGLADGGRVKPLRLRRDEPASTGHRFIGAEAAAQIADILRGVPRPEPWAQIGGAGRERQIAYKTGTSYGFRDAWAVGYSGAWTVGVWVGRADGTPRPDRYGRDTAAPILFKTFDLLPGEKPQNETLLAASKAPLGLRALHRADEARKVETAPRILFPIEGTIVELGREGGIFQSVALKAEGRGTLSWIVNGLPLAAPGPDRAAFWQPDGEGFARIVVQDEAGHSASVGIRVKAFAGD